MPSWLTKTTVPPLLTGKMSLVRSKRPHSRALRRADRTLLVTVEIHDLLQTNCHCIIPVDAEGKMRQGALGENSGPLFASAGRVF